jgi:hypothetical protein
MALSCREENQMQHSLNNKSKPNTFQSGGFLPQHSTLGDEKKRNRDFCCCIQEFLKNLKNEHDSSPDPVPNS